MKNTYLEQGETIIIYAYGGGEVHKVLIDTLDFDIANSFPGTWVVSNNRGKRYVVGAGNVRLHRLIMGVTDPKVQVDHMFHDTLDNRRYNLRVASPTQNQRNRKGAQSNNKSSGVRGVHWDKSVNKWRVRLSINKKEMFLGQYADLTEAAMVAVSSRNQIYGVPKCVRKAIRRECA